jgi:hypothetical protein
MKFRSKFLFGRHKFTNKQFFLFLCLLTRKAKRIKYHKNTQIKCVTICKQEGQFTNTVDGVKKKGICD